MWHVDPSTRPTANQVNNVLKGINSIITGDVGIFPTVGKNNEAPTVVLNNTILKGNNHENETIKIVHK